MTTFSIRQARFFFEDALDPLQRYIRALYERDHQVEALYLSAQVVAFAIRRGVLRDVISFMSERTKIVNRAHPIETAADIAQDIVRMGSFDLLTLPAVTSIVQLGRQFGFENPSYEDIYDSVKFGDFSNRFLTAIRREAIRAPSHMVIGMLASTTRLASLEGMPVVQRDALAALDSQFSKLGKYRVGMALPTMDEHLITLPRLANLAQKVGDPDTAIAFDLFGDSGKFNIIAGSVLPLSDHTYSTARKFLDAGQAGTAAHLFDAAIDQSTVSRGYIAKILQEEEADHGLASSASRRRPSRSSPSDRLVGSSGARRTQRMELPEPGPSIGAFASSSNRAEAPNQIQELKQHAEQPSQQRTLNASIDNAHPKVDEAFHVDVMIGTESNKHLAYSGPFNEPDWGNRAKIDLLISLSGLNCEVDPSECLIELPKTGSTKEVTFSIVAGVEGPLELTIRVFLPRQMILLQSCSFIVGVESALHQVAA